MCVERNWGMEGEIDFDKVLVLIPWGTLHPRIECPGGGDIPSYWGHLVLG